MVTIPATTDIRLVRAPNREVVATIEPGLKCDILNIPGAAIKALPEDIEVRMRLDLSNAAQLETLPSGLKTGSLILSNCTGLSQLPNGLDVAFLDLTGCSSLTSLPDDLKLRGGVLCLRDCPGIMCLPDGMGEVAGLDLSGCMNLVALPEGLTVTSWVDLAGTQIQDLPERFQNVGLRWRGISVSHRIVFEPDTLDPSEILAEENTELRRVMMERYGYDSLFEALDAEVLDRDRDAGGERKLMRIAIEDDEPLVCVAVQCPSTGHKFVLRVPPAMSTCQEAVAWTAGFDNPKAYKPVRET